MKSKLQILLLEDDDTDAELIAHELEASGFSFRLARVETEAELRHEIDTEKPDLVLSDHGLPHFDGFKALEIVRETRPELPFIFISGSNDQGMVAEMYEQGATDYVFKRDLGDLKSAVLEALEPRPWVKALQTTSADVPAQSELKLQLPVAPTEVPVCSPAIGRLLFCPQCRQLRDEAHRSIPMENYFSSYAEIIVLRQPCADCQCSAN